MFIALTCVHWCTEILTADYAFNVAILFFFIAGKRREIEGDKGREKKGEKGERRKGLKGEREERKKKRKKKEEMRERSS